jgi:2-phospho-L-lactate guanylyltransferase
MNLTKQIKIYFLDNKKQKNSFLRTLPTLKNVKELGKGLANINYLLSFNDGSEFIMRFNFWEDKDWYTGNIISIRNEYQVLKFLEKSTITPKVFFVDVSKKIFPFKFLIEEYISHDDMKVDFDFPGVVKSLKKLHKTKITDEAKKVFREDANSKNKIKLYSERLKSIQSKKHNEVERIFFEKKEIYVKYIDTIKNVLSGDSIIHHDPFPENFLHKDFWHLIDWQTAVIGNHIHDVAYLLMDFIYQFTLGRKLQEKEKNLILQSYYGKKVNLPKKRKMIDSLLPVYYIDLFLFLIYKEAELKSQNFPKPLFLFLRKRLLHGRNIILEKREILFWFKEMEDRLS